MGRWVIPTAEDAVIEQMGAGLFAGTIASLPGLLVVGGSEEEVRDRLPAAVAQIVRAISLGQTPKNHGWDIRCAGCGREYLDPGGSDAEWSCRTCGQPITRAAIKDQAND